MQSASLTLLKSYLHLGDKFTGTRWRTRAWASGRHVVVAASRQCWQRSRSGGNCEIHAIGGEVRDAREPVLKLVQVQALVLAQDPQVHPLAPE